MPRQPTPSPRATRKILGLTSRVWLGLGAAFLIGLLLFAMVWTKQRSKNDFFRTDDAPRDASGRQLQPLPTPDTGRIATDTTPAQPAERALQPPQVVDDQPRPLEDTTPLPSIDSDDAAQSDVEPVAVDSPPPRYPRASISRREAGEVLLRIHVDTRGQPGQIDLVRGSGSPRLDHAAVEAVRVWRFRPAMRAGQPVNGVKLQQIAFSLPR